MVAQSLLMLRGTALIAWVMGPGVGRIVGNLAVRLQTLPTFLQPEFALDTGCGEAGTSTTHVKNASSWPLRLACKDGELSSSPLQYKMQACRLENKDTASKGLLRPFRAL